jgi:glycerophosphoryl diester phosphodiesterase
MKNNKQTWKRFLFAGLAATVITTGVNLVDMQAAQAKVKFDVFDFQAHRGGRDARPENTLYSFAYAQISYARSRNAAIFRLEYS